MSEAVNPNHDAESLPTGEPNPSVVSPSESVPTVVAAALEDDWQTVDFPGALPMVELIQASSPIEHPASAPSPTSSTEDPPLVEVNPGAQDTESLQNLVHYLRRENSSLRSQVLQLEQDLTQVQVELQLEVTRFYCKESEDQAAEDTATPSAPNLSTGYEADEWLAAQAQIQQLTQDLEQSQQTVHQQQQRMNTLTEQVESSQERIAQLERDCALSQERYIQQGQQVIQLENTCNDLRMRLNRQQQQTLQFKAALEKSLEMPPAISSEHIISSSDTVINFPTPDTAEGQGFIPKAQPVKPWSGMAESTPSRIHSVPPKPQAKELPNVLKLFGADTPVHSHPSDVLGDEAAVIDLTTPPAELLALENSAIAPPIPVPSQPETPDLDALFPDVPPIAIVPDAPAQEAIFDLSPFLEAGEVDPLTLPAAKSSAAPEAIAPATSQADAEAALNPPQENNLWADLARLIKPDMVTENAAIDPDLTIQIESQSIESRTPESQSPESQTPEFESTEHAPSHRRIEAIDLNELILQGMEGVNRAAAGSSSPQAVNPFAQPQPSLEAPWVAEMHPGSPFITVNPVPRESANDSFREPVIPTVNSLDSTPLESAAHLPSPALHPFRPAKKIKSMASVELPSFPRTAQ